MQDDVLRVDVSYVDDIIWVTVHGEIDANSALTIRARSTNSPSTVMFSSIWPRLSSWTPPDSTSSSTNKCGWTRAAARSACGTRRMPFAGYSKSPA